MMAMPTARATYEPSRKRLGLSVGIAIALLRQRRSLERYRNYRCVTCEGPVSWIAEAPGSTEGLACESCRTIWNAHWNGKRTRVRVHPYARLA